MKTTTELFGENLRYKLIEQRKNQADIARYLKVTEATVSLSYLKHSGMRYRAY